MVIRVKKSVPSTLGLSWVSDDRSRLRSCVSRTNVWVPGQEVEEPLKSPKEALGMFLLKNVNIKFILQKGLEVKTVR